MLNSFLNEENVGLISPLGTGWIIRNWKLSLDSQCRHTSFRHTCCFETDLPLAYVDDICVQRCQKCNCVYFTMCESHVADFLVENYTTHNPKERDTPTGHKTCFPMLFFQIKVCSCDLSWRRK